MADAIKFKGNPLTLEGNAVNVGDNAPDAALVDQSMNERKLSEFFGKTVVISTVPSLDTPTCDTQTRTFNQKAAEVGDDVVILTVSMDLPPAQKRWCGDAGVDQVETLSDYKHGEFGRNWGLRIKELGLLARSVWVIDPQGKVQYKQLVEEVSEEPKYDEALDAVKSAA